MQGRQLGRACIPHQLWQGLRVPREISLEMVEGLLHGCVGHDLKLGQGCCARLISSRGILLRIAGAASQQGSLACISEQILDTVRARYKKCLPCNHSDAYACPSKSLVRPTRCCRQSRAFCKLKTRHHASQHVARVVHGCSRFSSRQVLFSAPHTCMTTKPSFQA